MALKLGKWFLHHNFIVYLGLWLPTQIKNTQSKVKQITCGLGNNVCLGPISPTYKMWLADQQMENGSILKFRVVGNCI